MVEYLKGFGRWENAKERAELSIRMKWLNGTGITTKL
jgi:hypothetical protein